MTTVQTLTKRRADAPTGFFEAEAAGLEWLAAAEGARVVRVVEVTATSIELERVEQSRPDPTAAREFGRRLARTHAAGAPAFGAPPDGYAGQLFIGSRPMATAREDSWGTFYARDRILPFLEIAVSAGTVDGAAERVIRLACERIAAGEFDDGQPPARIHGDLWTGNLLWSRSGATLIDPAAHGGHRETDLAMLALFGCPYLGEVIAGYEEDAPLEAGWRQRVPLHQLHPLAVHAAGHGPAYGRALHHAAESTLEL